MLKLDEAATKFIADLLVRIVGIRGGQINRASETQQPFQCGTVLVECSRRKTLRTQNLRPLPIQESLANFRPLVYLFVSGMLYRETFRCFRRKRCCLHASHFLT